MPDGTLRVIRKAAQRRVQAGETVVEISKNLQDCINRISAEFTDKTIKRLPASDFDFLESRYSSNIIIEAKKALAIRSTRTEDGWFWSRPRFTNITAIERAGLTDIDKARRLDKKKLQRGSVNTLRQIMKDHNFIIENKLALDLMINLNMYSKCSTMLAKSILGIPTIKRDGRCVWVLPDKKVQDWLLDKLRMNPLTPEEVFKAAEAEQNWDRLLITVTRLACPGIKDNRSDVTRILRWVNVNAIDRVISVDFEEDEEDSDEFVTVNGLKIQKFK